MSVISFKQLKDHIGHRMDCVSYGDKDNPENVAIECENCMEIMIDFDAS